ncbi:MAG TPA: chemotaxis protein CheB [Dongiaceae bacterium]|jgi:two-component system chemotaxis response regulator CheB
MDKSSPGHDVIVIGASSGGVDALRRLVQDLPADIPASIFAVVHIGVQSHLAEILDAISELPVEQGRAGARIERGKFTVAGPGAHLMLHDGHMLVCRGPRENMARPAIDPLFRSAAASFGGRVIGVVLTGSLNDGTAGLRAIKRCGGLAVVQDPADASVSEMPESALRHVEIDQVAPLTEMGALLGRLARQPAGATPAIPLDIRLETAIAAQDISNMKIDEKLGSLSPFTCPECNGALWEIDDGFMLRYRCHTGHAFTAEAALSAETTEIDVMLEKLLRAHRERAALTRRMANSERAHGRWRLADLFAARAEEYEGDAQLMLRLARHRDDQTEVSQDEEPIGRDAPAQS